MVSIKSKAKKTKSRVSNKGLAKKKGFHFKLWMALVVIGLIAVVGIAVVYVSNAAHFAYLTFYNTPGLTKRGGTLVKDGVNYVWQTSVNHDAVYNGSNWQTTTYPLLTPITKGSIYACATMKDNRPYGVVADVSIRLNTPGVLNNNPAKLFTNINSKGYSDYCVQYNDVNKTYISNVSMEVLVIPTIKGYTGSVNIFKTYFIIP